MTRKFFILILILLMALILVPTLAFAGVGYEEVDSVNNTLLVWIIAMIFLFIGFSWASVDIEMRGRKKVVLWTKMK